MSVLNMLSEIGVDTSSVVRGVQSAGQLDFSEERYKNVIRELTEQDDFEGDTSNRHTFMYFVQEVLKGSKVYDAFNSARLKSELYVSNNMWCLAKSESSYVPKSIVDVNGNPKKKKGAKKEMVLKLWKENKDKGWKRKEWIEFLMKEVSLSKGGASTYHHNCRSGLWT